MNLVGQMDQIFVSYRKPIENYIYFRVKDRELAQDLSQEVFLKMVRSLRLFDSARSLSAWLWTIVKNTLVDHQRSSKYEQNLKKEILSASEFPSSWRWSASPEDVLIQKQSIRELGVMLTTMKTEQLEVIRLRLIEGLKMVEIADHLGVSVSQVKSLLHRTRTRLLAAQVCPP